MLFRLGSVLITPAVESEQELEDIDPCVVTLYNGQCEPHKCDVSGPYIGKVFQKDPSWASLGKKKKKKKLIVSIFGIR